MKMTCSLPVSSESVSSPHCIDFFVTSNISFSYIGPLAIFVGGGFPLTPTSYISGAGVRAPDLRCRAYIGETKIWKGLDRSTATNKKPHQMARFDVFVCVAQISDECPNA